MARWNGGSARASWSSWQQHDPTHFSHLLREGQANTSDLFHWLCPDLSSKELQISPCLQWLPKKLLQSIFQRFGLAKETGGGILSESLGAGRASASHSSPRGPNPPHTDSKADPFSSAILPSSPARVPVLSRLCFQTSQMDLKISQGKMFRFLWLLLTPHNEIFLL